MAKRVIRTSSMSIAKTMGRSRGPLVIDPVIGDKVTVKMLAARKTNNPSKYKNVD